MIDVKRLAAADMYGTAGSARRRQLVRAEFFVGALACWLLGVVVLATGSGLMILLGAWLVGIGLNYVPLALHAQSLSRDGALQAELAGTDPRTELRRAGVNQLWILVPLSLIVFDVASRRTRRDQGSPCSS